MEYTHIIKMVKKDSSSETVEIAKSEPKLSDLPGIGPAAVAKLEAGGIFDLMTLATKTTKELADVAGVGEAVARKAIQAARSMLNLGFMDGVEYANKRKDILTITTRSKDLDEGIGADPEKVLKNIFVARAFNSDHQILLLEKISELIRSGEPIKLLIIDSLTAHFRAEYAGRGTLAERQHKLGTYLHNLMKLAETHNLAIYVTNQVMSNPAQMFGDPTVAIGGNIVGHASTYRIYLRRGKQGSRVAKMIDSPNLPDNEAIFFVTKEGVKDE